MESGWFCSRSAVRFIPLCRAKRTDMACLLLTLLVTGCHVATAPDRIRPDYTSPDTFRELDCRELAMKIVTFGYQIEDLHQRLSKRHKRDQWQLAFSWFYGVSAAFIDGDGADAVAFRRLQGDFEAARVQAVRKDCGFEAATRETVFLNAKASLSGQGNVPN